jgi:PAS domain-containing protein
MLHPEDKANAIANFKSYYKNPEGMYESYFRMSHSDGSWVWMWSRGKYIGDGIIVGTDVNITQHKLAEDAIQQERALLRTLIDNLPDAIYIKDAEGKRSLPTRRMLYP